MSRWEHFGAPAPKSVGYSTSVPSGNGEVVSPTGVKTIYRARPWRRASMKQSSGISLAKVIDKDENFYFRPYAIFSYRNLQVQISEEVCSKVVLVPGLWFPRRLSFS